MNFGSKYVYLGNDQEDEEEVKIDEDDGMVLTDSDVSDDDGESCLLDIFDTAGQEEYSSLKDRYVTEGDGFVIIYSITDRESFKEAEAIFRWLKRLRKRHLHCILVSNKQDLKDKAVVSPTVGRDLASRLNIPFYETSAKTGQGVQDAMHGLVRLIPRTGSEYKIAMLGSGAVGKSCVTLRFVSDIFVTDYDPTVEDSYRKLVSIPGLTAVSKDVKKAKKEKKKNECQSSSFSDISQCSVTAAAPTQQSPKHRRLFHKMYESLVKTFSSSKKSAAAPHCSQPPPPPQPPPPSAPQSPSREPAQLCTADPKPPSAPQSPSREPAQLCTADPKPPSTPQSPSREPAQLCTADPKPPSAPHSLSREGAELLCTADPKPLPASAPLSTESAELLCAADPKPPPPDPGARRVKKVKQRKADANVVLIELGSLAEDPKLVSGNAVKCGQCSAVLTSTSTLVPDGHKQIWNCEFCGHANRDLDIDDDEIPKGDCSDYMLSPATKPKEEEHKGEATAARKETTPGVIVYCIDVSESMLRFCYVPESQKAWREERTRGAETIGRVSRLDCIRKAVTRLAEQHKEEQPNKQILLTVFNYTLRVKGGGRPRKHPKFDNLRRKSFEQCIEEGLTLSNEYPLKPLAKSYGDIARAVRKLKAKDGTGLGPALSICTGFVSEIPGSEIVLCTDGEPNVGIGALDTVHTYLTGDDDSGHRLYHKIGDYARSKNITISILATEGDNSVGLPYVSVAAENCGGATIKLNPFEIVRELRTIAQNKIIASSVTVRLLLHPDFVVDELDFEENLSQVEKEVGVARIESDLIFRYRLRDLSKKTSLDKVPFQFQITYTRPDGMVCLRVLSKAIETTSSRQSMEQGIDVSVVGITALKKMAKLAQAGNGIKALAMLKSYKRMVHRCAVTNQQKEERMAFEDQVYDLEAELTDNTLAYTEMMQTDYSYNLAVQAISRNLPQQRSVSRRMDQIRARKMARNNVTNYYNYRDNC